MRLLSRQSRQQARAALAFNEEARKAQTPGALPDDSGHVAFNMPELDYYYWIWRKPELRNGDAESIRKAWREFLNSPDGERYKLNKREGKKAPRLRGIVVK
jgi:hypothetical protein